MPNYARFCLATRSLGVPHYTTILAKGRTGLKHNFLRFLPIIQKLILWHWEAMLIEQCTGWFSWCDATFRFLWFMNHKVDQWDWEALHIMQCVGPFSPSDYIAWFLRLELQETLMKDKLQMGFEPRAYEPSPFSTELKIPPLHYKAIHFACKWALRWLYQ